MAVQLQTPARDTASQLWDEFLSSRSAEARDKLIAYYTPWVRRIWSSVHHRVPESIAEDLWSVAMVGLWEAINRYDRGIGEFKSFAARRIRGSMRDEMRNSDWLSRVGRTRRKRIDTFVNLYFARNGHNPDENALRKHLGVSKTECANWLRQTGNRAQELNQACWDDEEFIDIVACRNAENPTSTVECNDLAMWIWSQLRGRSKEVFYYRVVQGHTPRRMARVLGLKYGSIYDVIREMKRQVALLMRGFSNTRFC